MGAAWRSGVAPAFTLHRFASWAGPPIGVHLSAGILRHARSRLPTQQADAGRLPIRDDSMPAVIAMMVHTDMPASRWCSARWPESCALVGSSCMWVSTPRFCGGFADRSDIDAVMIRPGYLDGHWTKGPGAIEGCVPESVQHTARCQS